MIDPRIIIKANHDRTLVIVRSTAIDSSDWVDIVGSRIELSYDSNFANIFYANSTNHYKVRAYLEDFTPNQTVYGRVTLTKNDNTTLQKTFNFVTPYPVLGTVKDEETTQYITSMRKMDKNGNLSPRNYTNRATTDVPAHIDIMADETGEMIIANQWTTPILVQNITQGTAQVEVAGGNRANRATIAVNEGDTVRILESDENVTFRRFSDNGTNGLCMGVSAHISIMPSMDKFTTDEEGTIPSNYFFYHFNHNGTLTSLPEGSFEIHKITKQPSRNSGGYRYGFFGYFNSHGALTSLPEGSFDTSNLILPDTHDGYTNDFPMIISHYSFQEFNAYGALTSLPEGSFDFENIETFGNGSYILQGFNQNGALTSLPEGSFGFSNLTVYSANFKSFNDYGRLTTLPAGAFHFHEGSFSGGADHFAYFNRYGSLVSLPEHSFNFTIGIVERTASVGGFNNFNMSGALTSLPEDSFRFTPNATISGTDWSFCQSFNQNGALASLPEDSFNTEGITSVGMFGFKSFNQNGALASLPEDSFNFDNLVTAGTEAFSSFNKNGALKTLPKGSFNFENLTNINGYSFCAEFNRNGALEYLPIDSFSVNNVTSVYQSVTVSWQPFSGFNNGGKLTKSDTDYNPNHIYPTQSQITTITAYYYEPSTQTQFAETISGGNPFKYYQADYFNVSYAPSQAYTTNLADKYLSGQTITFSASAIDPEYMATPAITTDGGATVAFTDNGDDTFTFVMPQDNINVTFAVALRPATITLVADEAGTMIVTNKWSTPVIVTNVTQGTSPVSVLSTSTANIPVDADDVVTVTESSASITFRTWSSSNNGFANGVDSHITEMPSMDRFTTNNTGVTTGQYFFTRFCRGINGKGITSLPAGSFDTSNIVSVGIDFFSGFHHNGKCTGLPAGSFRLNSALTSVPNNFFENFNYSGNLTSLPAGSFNTENITTIGRNFFSSFNYQGKLASLPTGSFSTNNITNVSSATNFLYYFNTGGQIPKDTNSYNSNFINPTNGTITAYYQGIPAEYVTQGNPFYYKTA